MKLAFEKLLETNNLEISELPKITQIEIKELNSLKALVESKQKIGQNVTAQTLQKLKDKDNEIVEDILDFLDGSDEDDSDDDTSDDDTSDDDTSDDDTSDYDTSDDDDNDFSDQDGVLIDKELHQLFKAGNTTLELSQIRSLAPTTYECIFETYGQDEQNGINTSNYSIIETSTNSETFKISKK
jgi:hypothetical protein